tara:strand:+ start:817 stop:978 length:162 start_codon:yes stop_codon:yes gene_type:complete
MGKNYLTECSLEEAKEYFSKYKNADDRVAAWKVATNYTEKKPAAKKEEKANEE